MGEQPDGYAETNGMLSPNPAISCRVTVPPQGQAYKGSEKFKISNRQARLNIVFHELRHCSPQNKALSAYEKEVDADYHGGVIFKSD